jgi:hypothetical protein
VTLIAIDAEHKKSNTRARKSLEYGLGIDAPQN